MKKQFLYKFTLILCIFLVSCAKYENNNIHTSDLYQIAMQDAVWAEESEIYPLFSLSDPKMATLSPNKEQVLLLSWHNKPEQYVPGQEIELGNWVIWTFTDKEIIKWYQNNYQNADWNLRLKQLIGLPSKSNYTHFTAFWVDIKNVKRPAYITDVYSTNMSNEFEIEPASEYKKWFDDNILSSYFYSSYPWTRLGYTYDWANNNTDYGLSEFIILPYSRVKIEWTKSTVDFLQWLFSKNY